MNTSPSIGSQRAITCFLAAQFDHDQTCSMAGMMRSFSVTIGSAPGRSPGHKVRG
jgi:hypothetical protein